MPRRARPALTLLEVLLTIGLLALLASLLWPDFLRFGRGRELRESAGRMQALVAACRAAAMSEVRTYRLEFRADGSVRPRRQLDPVRAPQRFVRFEAPWLPPAVLLETVWVESVRFLPDGPAPIRLEDDRFEFIEDDLEPVPVAELQEPLTIDFAPDGTSPSLRWVLRDAEGFGLALTLDGRLGRVTVSPVERLEPDAVQRPAPLPPEPEEPTEAELLAELNG